MNEKSLLGGHDILPWQITCDWEHAYVGCSAKENSNIGAVWRELLLVTRNTGKW